MVNKKEIYNQKEKNMFWMALLIGVVGGFLGNLVVAYLFDFKESFSLVSLAGVLIFTFILIVALLYMRGQIKSVNL